MQSAVHAISTNWVQFICQTNRFNDRRCELIKADWSSFPCLALYWPPSLLCFVSIKLRLLRNEFGIQVHAQGHVQASEINQILSFSRPRSPRERNMQWSRKLHKIGFKLYQDEGKTIDCHIKSWKFFTSRRPFFIEKSSHFRNGIFLHPSDATTFPRRFFFCCLMLLMHTKCKVHLCFWRSATRNVNIGVSSALESFSMAWDGGWTFKVRF